MPRLDLGVALGVGVAGALVDVSSYARLTDGLSYRWGRSDAFYGAEPGTFSFVLDNADGRFTPENPNSPLDTTLTEGMAACISVEGRLTAGTVRSIEPEFPSGEAAWSRVRVSCDDALGELARTRIDDPTQAAALGVGAGAFWPFSDPAGSTLALDVSGNAQPFPAAGLIELGVDGTAPGGATQGTLSSAAAVTTTVELTRDSSNPFSDSMGPGTNVGVWVTPRNAVSFLEFLIDGEVPSSPGFVASFRFGIQNDRFSIWTGASYVTSEPFLLDTAYFISGAWSAGTFIYKINGVQVATYAEAAVAGSASVTIQVGGLAYGASLVSVANLAVTLAPLLSATLLGGTAGDAFAAFGQMSPAMFGSAPAGLSAASLTLGDVSGGSLLDAVNLLVESEQGHLYAATSGTLTSPAETVELRERDRPETVTASFDVEDELSGAPMFIRDITNLVSRVTVNGGDASTAVSDASLSARASNASTSAETLLVERRDRRAWGQDRIRRGANTTMQIASVVVDAMTTPTDRSADLLALVPGDRVQFTGLPETQLGFSTWDGWFLGADETHTLEEHTFALYFQPVLPPVAKYDTAKYMASGEITTNGSWTLGGTSVQVKSIGAGFSSTAVPYVMQVDDEQVNVTAVSGSPSAQTLTVTRGVNGTTAATHAGDTPLVGPIPESIYAF